MKSRLQDQIMCFYHSVILINKLSIPSLEVKRLKLGDLKPFPQCKTGCQL